MRRFVSAPLKRIGIFIENRETRAAMTSDAPKNKVVDISVGAPILLTESEHEAFQKTGVMPDGVASSVPVRDDGAEASRAPSDDAAITISPGSGSRTSEAKADPEELRVKGQQLAVVSFVAPPRSNHMALKVRGVFDDQKEAEEHARRLMKADPDFDICVISMYNWIVLPVPDDLMAEIEHKYVDERLQKIMTGYHEQKEKVKEYNLQRIREAKELGARGECGEPQPDAVPTEIKLLEGSATETTEGEKTPQTA